MRRFLTRKMNGEHWAQIWAMQHSCQSSCAHDICSRRRVEAPELVNEMEMECVDVLMSALPSDVCISVRSMNRPSCAASIVGWLKNVISISWSRGAFILATKLSRYLLDPRYLRRIRAGRTMRSPAIGGKARSRRRG